VRRDLQEARVPSSARNRLRDGKPGAYFLEGGYDYTGLDATPAMLMIAAREVPGARFVRGDMRRFSFPRKCDAVLKLYL